MYRSSLLLVLSFFLITVNAQSKDIQYDKISVKELRNMADRGDADAQAKLGIKYIRGQGVSQDFKQALTWSRKAAEQGNAAGQFNMGVLSNVDDDYKLAATWFRKSAEQGNVEAQDELGTLYALGHGVEHDDVQAAAWYRKAAEQGFVEAQLNLGGNYEKGEGVLQDYKQAALWYAKAAEKGDSKGQNMLGWLYVDGKGVPKDLVLAYMLFNLSAAQKNEQSVTSRAEITKKMAARQIQEGQELSRNWRVGTALPIASKTGQSSSK